MKENTADDNYMESVLRELKEVAPEDDFIVKAKEMAEEGEIVDISQTARKNDSGKPMVDLVDPDMIIGVAEVSTYGAKKYGIDNWKRDMQLRKMYAAALRHLLTYAKGEVVDPETSLKHLYQAIWNCEKLMWYFNNTKGADGQGRHLLNDQNGPELYKPLGRKD